MRRLLFVLTAAALVAGLLAVPAGSAVDPAQQAGAIAEPPGSFELVGHNPLEFRGMNAALAVHGDYAYIGSRTDGPKANSGVMVVDVSDPADPTIVSQIGGPIAEDGYTTREMRVWPQQELLIILNLASNCSYLIHVCSPTSATKSDTYLFFDISGDKGAAPELVAEYDPSENPHEFFLWVDPKRPNRALMYSSTPGGGNEQMLVTDISGARNGKFTELGTWSTLIPDPGDNRLHSLSVNTAGTRGYIAYLQGGFLEVDLADFAKGKAKPEVRLITSTLDRPRWEGPGAHSAVKLPGRDYALVTDEVYGRIPVLLANHGCPWGWTRIISLKNHEKPSVVSEYKIAANTPEFCDSPVDNPAPRNSMSSWSAHNPTLTKNLAFISWHSGGLQAINLKNPNKPGQAAEFRPDPLPVVATEDPVLSSGIDKVVVWSYPIIKDGLIYVVDVRNGLYILSYDGPFAAEVTKSKFLEGNSNLGDALRFEKP